MKSYVWLENKSTCIAIKCEFQGFQRLIKIKNSTIQSYVRTVQCRLWMTHVMPLSKGQWVTQEEKNKLRVSVFHLNEPKVEFSMGYFHHALWLYAPVAVHAHHVLLVYTLPLPPCDPDSARQAQTQTNYCVSKLLSPLRQTFPLISTPFPEEVSACLLIPMWQQLSTCRVMGQVPMKVTAVRSLHERIGPRFTLLPKQPLHLHRGRCEGGTWASPTLDLSVWCLRDGKCWDKQAPLVHGGLTCLRLTLH